MNISLHRFSHGSDSTIGVMTYGDLVLFTCEDEFRQEKVYGETRIPAGTYPIKLRMEGGKQEKYTERYPFHRGMLWLQDVPNFEWVYIHVGNTDDDTLGCILVGMGADLDSANGGGKITRSSEAYKKLCLKIHEALDNGEEVSITISDHLSPL